MMLFNQKSVVIAATVALLAFVANNNNNQVMVSAQAEDKDDKDDAMMEGPVEINTPELPETMVPSSNGTIITDDDELELPFASDDDIADIAGNVTDLLEDIIDAIFYGCECEGTVISCSDPEDATMCMCEADGTVVCQDEPVVVDQDDDFDPMFDVEPVVTEAPVVAPPTEGATAPTSKDIAPIAEPVAVDPHEPPAPDAEAVAETSSAAKESEAVAMTPTNAVVSMVLSAAGLVAALN